MNKRQIVIAALLAVLPVCGLTAQAQQTPHIGYVFPAGGQQGKEFEVRVGGQFLDGVAKARITGPGIHIEVAELVKPMTQKDANDLRDKLKVLMDRVQGKSGKSDGAAANNAVEKNDAKGDNAGKNPAKKAGTSSGGQRRAAMQNGGPLTAAERQTVLDIRKKLQKFYNRPPNPAIAQTAVLRVATSPDALPGVRELRLETPLGLTNPLVFEVGRLSEIVKKPVEDDDLPGQRPYRKLRGDGGSSQGEQPIVDVQMPVLVNGQILPGQVDRYRFAAKKGQQLIIAVSAQQLVPYIADAVPGWFQAAISLRDEQGSELAYADNFRFHPDPVLHYEIPRDGHYIVAINDSCYRGREDFVYRLALGELPFVTDIFPLGGKTGEQQHVTLRGWNLPCRTLTEDAVSKPAGIDWLQARSDVAPLNRLPFALDSLPECVEQEPNDSPENAQRVTLPIVVNGRIDRPGDRDVFRFEGKAGQAVVAEVYARRLDSPLDSVLKLTDAAGRQLAFNDDFEDRACGLVTHQADSWLRTVLPTDGTYYVHLYDAQHEGGPEYGYRLRISPPRPDFELRVVPSSVNIRAGSSEVITVHAVRRDGFNGPITLALKDVPAGFRLSGGAIANGQRSVRLTLTAPLQPGLGPAELHLEGRATIDGKDVRHPAVPADDRMQAFFNRHLVPAEEWLVDIVGRGRGPLPFKLRVGQQEIRLISGGTTAVHFIGPHGPMIKMVRLALSEPPEGLSIQNFVVNGEGMDVVLRADAANLKPGWRGNAIIEASVDRPAQGPKAKPNAPKRQVALGVLPAVPLEIVGKP